MNKIILSSILAGLFALSLPAQAASSFSTPWYETWLYKLDHKYSVLNDRLLDVYAYRANYVEKIEFLTARIEQAQESGSTRGVPVLQHYLDVYERRLAANDRNLAYLTSRLDAYSNSIERACSFFPPGSTGGGLCSASGG